MGNIVALGDSTKTHSVVIPKIELNLMFLNLVEKFLSVTWKISRFSPLIYTFSIVFCKIFQLKHRYRYDMLELAKMRYYIISYILENSKILYHLIYPTSRYNIRYISPKIYIFANTGGEWGPIYIEWPACFLFQSALASRELPFFDK